MTARPVIVPQSLNIDEVSGGLVVLEMSHHEAHEGCAYVLDAEDLTLNDGQTIIVAFKTDAEPIRVHMVANFATLTGGSLAIWEGANWTAESGTTIQAVNRRRLSTGMGITSILENAGQPTFTKTGKAILNPAGFSVASAERIRQYHVFGEKARIGAGASRQDDEMQLKPDTQYAFVFTSDGNSNKAWIELNWYEHSDGEV